jgi:protein-S-isoprenylcysteine O-methyltransferase Ste14
MGAVAFLYGIICYLLFLASFLYAIGFVGNLVVPKSIDSGVAGPLGIALLTNVILLGLFAVQHSVMARQGFKDWWTRLVPKSVERSTYVLLSSLLLFLLYWKWQPMPETVWSVENPAGRLVLQVLFWAGWAIVLLGSFMIDHFDLFGLRQVWSRLRGRAYSPPGFRKPAFYRYVRHPLMFGFLVAFWATPDMSQGHLLFSLATTGYILIGVFFEERDLVKNLGTVYVEYRREVSMVLPLPRRKAP